MPILDEWPDMLHWSLAAAEDGVAFGDGDLRFADERIAI